MYLTCRASEVKGVVRKNVLRVTEYMAFLALF